MSPEDPLDRLERLHEGLLKSYGSLERAVAVQDQRLKDHADDIGALRADFKESAAQLTAALNAVDAHCEERTQRIEEQIREQGNTFAAKLKSLSQKVDAELKALARKFDAERSKREWTVKEKAMIYAAMLGPIATAVLVFVQRGGG